MAVKKITLKETADGIKPSDEVEKITAVSIQRGFEMAVNTLYINTGATMQVFVLGRCVSIDDAERTIIFDTGSRIIWAGE